MFQIIVKDSAIINQISKAKYNSKLRREIKIIGN